MDHFEPVLIRLVLEVTAVGIGNGREEKTENRKEQEEGRQRSKIVGVANRPRFSPAREHPVQKAISEIEEKE